MTTEIRQAFNHFKERHFRAVQTDTQLDFCDNDSAKFYKIEKKVKQFWKDAKEAERDFLDLLQLKMECCGDRSNLQHD